MVGEALDAQNGLITHWSPTSSAKERRAFYQRRLALFAKIFFWTFVILLIWVNFMYWLEPVLAPANYQLINYVSAAGLVALAVLWRMVLVRRELEQQSLFAWDTALALVVGVVLGFAGAWSLDKPANVASMMIWALFMVFARVSIIPSRGTRTMLISAGALAPQVACAIYIVSVIDGPLYMGTPRLAFVIGCIIYIGVAVLLAGLGSEVLWGLRKQVDEAAQLGQYTLIEKIGAGGMGTVYKARHAMLRRPVALKLLNPGKGGAARLERFEREVQLTSELTSQNTIRIHDYGRSPDGIFYYVMEYLEGITLEQLVHRHGPQPPGRVIHILAQVCNALEEAHERGMIHRDVKPANIMLCWRGTIPDVAKVLDFGLVKSLDEISKTESEVVAGTPAFMSPESIVSPELVGPATDLYSLGGVAYFLLTGRLVFTAKTYTHMCMQHVGTEPEPPSRLVDGIPAPLEQLVLECLSKSAERRPRSAAQLRRRLLDIDATSWTSAEARAWWEDNPVVPPAADEDGAKPSENTVRVDMSNRTQPWPPDLTPPFDHSEGEEE